MATLRNAVLVLAANPDVRRFLTTRAGLNIESSSPDIFAEKLARLDEVDLEALPRVVELTQVAAGQVGHGLVDVDRVHVLHARLQTDRGEEPGAHADVEYARHSPFALDEAADAPPNGLCVLDVAILVVEHREEVLAEPSICWAVTAHLLGK